MLKDAAEIYAARGRDTTPRGLLGLDAAFRARHMRFVAGRRAGEPVRPSIFAGAENPFLWMSGATDRKKRKNVFETRVIECRNDGGVLQWE